MFNEAARPNGSRVESHFNGSLASWAIKWLGVKGQVGRAGQLYELVAKKILLFLYFYMIYYIHRWVDLTGHKIRKLLYELFTKSQSGSGSNKL